MSVIFFHQNSVWGAQGGIERYLSTLLESAGSTGLIVSEAPLSSISRLPAQQIAIFSPFGKRGPKWLGYVAGVFLAARRIRQAIGRLAPCTLEFSRPEYFLFSWMFKGTKVFTLHGTGPDPKEPVKFWIHYLSCLMLPLVADVVQIVGRDPCGLPSSIRKRMLTRTRYIDAWYDSDFRVTPFPDPNGPLRVFFAGRLAPMKNPELLFKIIQAGSQLDGRFEFAYFGADADKIPAGLANQFPSAGLLSASQLAEAIANCHVGILCSQYGEGSPFIVVEALACGRAFVLPPLSGLRAAYDSCLGVRFAAAYTVDAFLAALTDMQSAMRSGLTPEKIAADVADRSKDVATKRQLERLESDHL